MLGFRLDVNHEQALNVSATETATAAKTARTARFRWLDDVVSGMYGMRFEGVRMGGAELTNDELTSVSPPRTRAPPIQHSRTRRTRQAALGGADFKTSMAF